MRGGNHMSKLSGNLLDIRAGTHSCQGIVHSYLRSVDTVQISIYLWVAAQK